MTDRIYIYALIDPRDNQVRYIGKTKNVEKRLKEHLNRSTITKKGSWIKSLKEQNLKPSIQIIDTTSNIDWITKEQYWIGMFSNLLNMTNGGENPPVFKAYKLNKDNVKTIIELYINTNLSVSDLSKLFNVSISMVCQIINGDTWKSVTNGNRVVSKFIKKNPNKNHNHQGSKSKISKLNETDVYNIKSCFDKETIYSISKRYNVSWNTINNIKNNKAWKHVNV